MTVSPPPADTDRLAEALFRADIDNPGGIAGMSYAATAAALAPVVSQIAARHAAEALQPFEELFAGGPDTSCRTTYPHDGSGGTVECVEVPMDDLRAAFAAAALVAAHPDQGQQR